MSEQQRLFNDEEAFEKASQPFGDRETANKAINGFLDEVYELRKKYGIANVLIGIKDSIKSEGCVMTCAQFGNSIEQEAMAAYMYGHAVSDRQRMISELLNPDKITSSTRRK
jgi:hypothetical protein